MINIHLLCAKKWLVGLSCVCLLTSCNHDQVQPARENAVDSLLDELSNTRDFDRMITMVDSLESEGDIREIDANLKRGWAYHKMRKFNKAEEYYNKVLTSNISTVFEQETYEDAAAYLADLYYIKHDYEGALHVAVPLMHQIEERGCQSDDAMILLLTSIGRCQMKLDRVGEAAVTFEKAYQRNLQAIKADSTRSSLRNAIVHTANIGIRFLNAKSFSSANMWLDRTETLLDQLAVRFHGEETFVTEYRARLHIYRAYALESLGRSEEAAAEYDAFTGSVYAKCDDGRFDACEYLIAAHRYDEAADILTDLDRMIGEWDYDLTLDCLQSYFLPKFRANVGAGRHDSAYAVAAQICESLDSAIYWQKHSDAAELATIYDMQQKENTITRQQADIKQARLLAIGIILGLLSLFLIFYILYRRNTMHRLAEKNAELKLANARAKESSEMKSDFIKQISHEIRTPLNILSGFTQVLTSTGMDIDENTRSDINRQITENTNRITGLVNKMLALSDAGSKMVIEQNDDVSPLQIATQAASDAGINEAKRIVFDLQVDDEAKTIMLHTNLQQSVSALSLLLDNALKFTKQGRVTLRVAIQSLASEHNILFTVEDTGIGVPPEEAEHIFEEFVQLDNYYNGTGIGLTIARSIARRLGGDIVLDTSYKEGARFVMSLKA